MGAGSLLKKSFNFFSLNLRHLYFQVLLKFSDGVINRHIVSFELLNDYQYEQIQHDILNEQGNHNEEK